MNLSFLLSKCFHHSHPPRAPKLSPPVLSTSSATREPTGLSAQDPCFMCARGHVVRRSMPLGFEKNYFWKGMCRGRAALSVSGPAPHGGRPPSILPEVKAGCLGSCLQYSGSFPGPRDGTVWIQLSQEQNKLWDIKVTHLISAWFWELECYLNTS